MVGAEPARPTGRLVRLGFWLVPPVACVLLYWYGLRAGYMRDDFAWLGLHLRVHDVSSFLAALFQPYAQGTIRPLSERLFFMAGWSFFGLNAAPLRAIVFLTQFANLALVAVLTRRLTGSKAAAFLAPLLWVVNTSLATPMSWTSAYNEILCTTFLLGASLLFVRYTEAGERRFYYAQVLVFLLGFGALELNVVYPAIALLYAVCCAPRYTRSTLPLFGLSVLYTLLHQWAAPPQRSDVYRMFFDAQIFSTLWSYVLASTGASSFFRAKGFPEWPFVAAQILVLLGLAGFAAAMVRRRRFLAVFLVGWFFIVLAPVAPLKNHITDYYLTIPVIGLAILGAWGIAAACQVSRGMAAVALLLAATYAAPSAAASRTISKRFYVLSHRANTFISSVAYAHSRYPDKALIIRGVDHDLFWAAWWDNPFQMFGATEVYLAPESESEIRSSPQGTTASRYVLGGTMAVAALDSGRALAYRVVDGARLQDDTNVYRAWLPRSQYNRLPHFLDAGRPLSTMHLPSGWWNPDGRYRWSQKRAVVELRGPDRRPGTLTIEGICPPEQIASGPLSMNVNVDGKAYAPSLIDANNLRFTFVYPLDASTVQKPKLDVAIEVGRTVRVPPDRRDLGLAFGTFAIAP